jgi:predicted alpha/beta superfamily hydrolase
MSTMLIAQVEKHAVETAYQNGKQEIRVLLPDDYNKSNSYRVLYVLPVEKGFNTRFGYGLGILKEMNAHNQFNLIIVQMGFEIEPWFGDHATDPKIRQASYVTDFVVPFIEKEYATLGTREGRLLLGFSKSGWGAFSLILKEN